MAWRFNPFTGKLDFYDDTTVAAHASTHKSAGGDSIKLDELAAPDDNTNLDFSTSAHGLVPKGTDAGDYLKDDGTWDTPAGGGGGGNVYVDRGDPASADFNQGDLTTDGAWHDLDLSGIIDEGAVLVHMTISIVDNAANLYIKFRKNGNSNATNIALMHNPVANIQLDGDILVACDEDGVIEYQCSNTSFTAIVIRVRGWWV
jgi:hypothetical protein